MTTHDLAGVTIIHPAALTEISSFELDQPIYSYYVSDRRHQCALLFTVVQLPPGEEKGYREAWFQDRDVLERRSMNGWDIAIERPHGPEYAAASIIGSHAMVLIGAVLDDRLADSDVSRWFDRVFRDAIDAVCAKNAATRASIADASSSPSHQRFNPTQ